MPESRVERFAGRLSIGADQRCLEATFSTAICPSGMRLTCRAMTAVCFLSTSFTAPSAAAGRSKTSVGADVLRVLLVELRNQEPAPPWDRGSYGIERIGNTGGGSCVCTVSRRQAIAAGYRHLEMNLAVHRVFGVVGARDDP